MPDPVAVNSMFSRIARRYDLANRLLSGGVDVWWRRCLVRAVRKRHPADVLDLATGSGDVAFALSRGLPVSTAIVGMDFCQPMLDEAEIKKAATPGTFANVVFRQGDGLSLPLPDQAFDAVTISFGLRNMADRGRALREMRRVLRPGGRLFVLEFSQPYRWFRPIYFFYLKRILPWVAGAVTGDRGAYDYLCGSVESFPSHAQLASELDSAGFKAVGVERLTLGIVALHHGDSPRDSATIAREAKAAIPHPGVTTVAPA
ncbi:MAG: bifunctional demethylmenaquinone methyltransferase/2-methoxy-6-polyprenyl-1,4-benzoquinol methylase UbiE [Opitutaceae bacterium]|nr:bifunctional demethylmenaquinone methyltransferase/2-methoxy-6-polyprenyl-1,4-benzoquinol methylase UbiE [Opitutaceae bacterium]